MLAKNWVRWVAYLGGWTLVGLFFASQTWLAYKYSSGNPHWKPILEFSLSEWYLWALLAPGVVWLARRFPIERGHLARSVPVHAAASILVALLHWELNNLCRRYVLHYAGATSLVYVFHANVVTYWLLVGAMSGYQFYVRYRRGELRGAQLSAQLAEARLQALRAQLHPHFLFNTLNAISALVHRDPEAADRMIARLSDLLRMALEDLGVQEVPLAKEIEFLKRYLEIEQTRFADRLTVSLEIAPETLGARTPYLILQPLVENAIRHGIAPRAQPGRVKISAKREDGFLVLEVSDDGPGIVSSGSLREGVGLSSTRERLEKLYGGRHRFEAKNDTGGGFVARLSIPIDSPREAPRDA